MKVPLGANEKEILKVGKELQQVGRSSFCTNAIMKKHRGGRLAANKASQSRWLRVPFGSHPSTPHEPRRCSRWDWATYQGHRLLIPWLPNSSNSHLSCYPLPPRSVIPLLVLAVCLQSWSDVTMLISDQRHLCGNAPSFGP